MLLVKQNEAPNLIDVGLLGTDKVMLPLQGSHIWLSSFLSSLLMAYDLEIPFYTHGRRDYTEHLWQTWQMSGWRCPDKHRVRHLEAGLDRKSPVKG
jgi:hypothetical protein